MRHRWLSAIVMATAIVLAVSAARAQPQPDRPARIAGRPNFNGIWQALNTAYWNLEGHSAEALNEFGELGAIAAIPAGRRFRAFDSRTGRELWSVRPLHVFALP